MRNDIYKYSQKPSFLIKYLNNSHFKERNVSVTSLYDENGTKHVWNVFYYGSEFFIKVPGSKKEKLTDIGCSVCGIKKSEISKLNIEKTNMAIKAMADINSFYMFYKKRCPEGELHNWKDDIGTKCSLSLNMVNQVNSNKVPSIVPDY